MKLKFPFSQKLNLHLFRHGQSIFQCLRLVSGLNELGLSGVGRLQTHLQALRMQHIHYDCIISSDLRRARETSDILQPYLSHTVPKDKVIYCPLLREKDQGVAKFKPLSVLEKVEECRNFRFPEGESWDDVFNRVYSLINTIVKHYLPEYQGPDTTPDNIDSTQAMLKLLPPKTDNDEHTVLLITHQGFIREFVNLIRLQNAKPQNYSNYFASNATLFDLKITLVDKYNWKCQIYIMNSKNENNTPFINIDSQKH